MKKILTLLIIAISGINFAQSEYIAYPSTGKGVATTFVTDYHSLGINPANLGWQQYPEKKVTIGTSEFGMSMYSNALSKQDLRDNIFGIIKAKSLDTLSNAQKIQAAHDFAGTDLVFNFDNNIFGASFQSEKFGGIAISIRTRASWQSNFNANFSDFLFQGHQSPYFDSLIYVDGVDTSMVANSGTYGDSTGTVLSGHASIPLNMSQILDGTYLRLSWNREFHVGYGRQLLNIDDKIKIHGGIGFKYIQGIAFFDLSSENGELKMVSAMSPGFDINYGIAAFTNPSAITPTGASDLFKSPVGNGYGLDFGAHALLLDKIHIAASITNIGKMTYTGNVYEAEDTLVVNFSNQGLEDVNVSNSIPDMLEESGLLKIKGRESYTVSLPGSFRLGGSIELGDIAHFGIDMVAPFNDVPGSFDKFSWGVGGDVKLLKGSIILMTGVTGGGGYDMQIPVGINFALKQGAYEFGIASRDAVTFFKDNAPTLSMAMGFARIRF